MNELSGLPETTQYNEYWTVTKSGSHLYSAMGTEANRYCSDEYRIYYNREAFDRDFPGAKFKQELRAN